MKGQVLSIDMIISFAFLLIAITVILAAWSFTSLQVAENQQVEKLFQKVLVTSNSVIRSKGLPTDWDSSNVQSIGLAENEGVLNSTKVYRFINLDYTRARKLLGTEKYEFFFFLSHVNGSSVFIQGINTSYGTLPQDTFVVAPIDRFVLLDGLPVKMTFILWV